MLALLALTPSAPAQWTNVAPGIAWRGFVLPGPVRVFVARADRRVKSWTVDSMTSLGEIKGGRETVPDMAARYTDTLQPDGRRLDIKVAVNGDYFDLKTGVALSGQILSGWFVKRYSDQTGSSGFFWTHDRRCVLGGNVQNGPQFQTVTFSDGARLKIHQLNEPRTNNALALYTWHYAPRTGTDRDGVEVLVRMSAPLGVSPPPGVEGRVLRVNRNTGNSPLPFNHVVLSAQGTAAEQLLAHAQPGQTLRIALDLKDSGNDEIGLPPADWRNARASLGAPRNILVNGHVPRDWEAKAARLIAEGKRAGSVIKDPRTGVAFNDRYLFFFVIDGRTTESIGMTFTEAALFCKEHLEATDAALLDGGGSSTLWVDGRVRNTPSGKGLEEKPGVLRPVANGFCIATLRPAKKTATFKPGQPVRLKPRGTLRLGPGTNFAALDEPAPTAPGAILDEPLNGHFAKGAFWWACRFGDIEAWAAETDLLPDRG
ncbi:MAG: phosphodiester glycosidase family protein [Verrucomicrobiales bacterium]|nr:phosphodiester glycosidase family protein [Verrucomicrobiales bacterium]